MAKYSGQALVAELDATDLSGQYTAADWKGTQPESDRIDVSDKSSYVGGEKEYVTGLRGETKVSGSIKANDVAGGTSEIVGLSLGDQGDLVIYPEGKIHAYPMHTIADITISDIQFSTGYASKAEWTVNWYGYTEAVQATYSTA